MSEPALLALAQEKFGALSPAEEELFRAAQEGRDASRLTGDEEEDRPSNAANWPANRAVRAKCISWVCTDPQAVALMTHRGLDLRGMRIEGELDLSNAEIKFSLLAWKCAFSEHISLRDAQLRGFYLVGCQMKSLNAGRALINSSLLLRGKGFKAEGEVDLLGATIGGNLDCSGAEFSRTKGVALSANGAKVEGSVFLCDGFRAEGEVNLVGATIGGNLDCRDAQFSNAKGSALVASDAHIEGGVFLRGRFNAEGEVTLAGTRIAGILDCSGGKFSNAEGLALTANGAKIEASVFLSDGFEAEGEVNLLGTRIGRNLDCGGAQFKAKGLALNAESSTIEATVFLGKGFTAQGAVNLAGATITTLVVTNIFEAKRTIFNLELTQVKTFWDDEKSWPEAGNLFLDGFRYERLYEKAPFQADSRKEWLSLQPRDRFRPQPYEQLAAVLRQMGHERDARLVTIEKNRERARFTSFPHQSWWWYNVFGRLIGYGYAPWRAFAMSLAMILLGTFLFTSAPRTTSSRRRATRLTPKRPTDK